MNSTENPMLEAAKLLSYLSDDLRTEGLSHLIDRILPAATPGIINYVLNEGN